MSEELDRLAAAVLLTGFEGPRVPESLRPWLERGIGGVCLFAWNVETPAQVAELTAELRRDRPDLVISIDEEGGDVTRLEAQEGSSFPGNLALGVVDDVELTERVAQAIGQELAAVGVNLNLAPVADVNTNAENPIVGVRSFGSDPALVARHVAAYVTGLQRAGVAACAKHFPGHGDTREDSHLELPTVSRDADEMAAALLPFRAAIDAGARAIMTAHIRVAGLDEAPGTISRAVITDLLRDELGFRGLVITDALEMRAISHSVGADEGGVRALEAGADALCLGHDLEPDSVHRAILDAVRSGRLGEERLREAAARVRDLGHPVSGGAANGAVSRNVGLEAARRAVRVEGAARLRGVANVVELLPQPSIAAGAATHGLAEHLHAGTEGAEQLVIVVQDAHRHPAQRTEAERILASSPDAVVVELGVPVWRPPGATHVATYGRGRVNLVAAAEALSETS